MAVIAVVIAVVIVVQSWSSRGQIVAESWSRIFCNENSSKLSPVTVILWCTQTAIEKRDYLLKMSAHDMIDNEYVHVMLSMRNIAFGVQTSLGKNTCEAVSLQARSTEKLKN